MIILSNKTIYSNIYYEIIVYIDFKNENYLAKIGDYS